MNGFKVLSVIALVVAICALTEGRAAKRDENLDNVVRALQSFVKKRQGGGQQGRQQRLSAEDVLYQLHVMEDELFLQKMLEEQSSYDYICLHLMGWLYAHNRALQMAEADEPKNDNGQNSTVRGLLKRVLFRMQRSGNNSSATPEPTASPESTGSPESTDSPETVEQISDESDESIMEEEDELEWIGWMTSCWMWELMVHGAAPDFPDWLWAVY